MHTYVENYNAIVELHFHLHYHLNKVPYRLPYISHMNVPYKENSGVKAVFCVLKGHIVFYWIPLFISVSHTETQHSVRHDLFYLKRNSHTKSHNSLLVRIFVSEDPWITVFVFFLSYTFLH